jgi:hypothetical protein
VRPPTTATATKNSEMLKVNWSGVTTRASVMMRLPAAPAMAPEVTKARNL